MSLTNVETVQKIYECFAKQDVPAILEHLAPDVAWEFGPNPTDIPWLQPRNSREDVANFFASLAQLEFRHFEVNALCSGTNVVVALVNLDVVVLSNGRKIVERDEPHIWRFNERGQVQSFRHAADTLAQWRAYHNRS
jgi:ketosteroid isomerase-like protein